MIVTFEDNGVSKLSEYPDNKSFDEISQLLHNSSVQMQYLEYFNLHYRYWYSFWLFRKGTGKMQFLD